MDENHQDKTESKLTATEDKSAPFSSSPQDQRGTDQLQNNQMKDTIKQLRARGYKVTEEYSTTGQLSKVSAEHPPRKTLQDWLQLVLLVIGAIAVPASILVGVWQFTTQQKTSAQMQATQVAASAAQTLDQQRQATLVGYLDEMSNLLLMHDLQTAKQGSPVLAIAQARTYTALQNLDGTRKGTLIRFLRLANLINWPKPIIIMALADLSGADLSGADLSGADLSGADLSGADLRDAFLHGADLSSAALIGADLSGADLSKAKLFGANLIGARLSAADLHGATYNTKTVQVKDALGNLFTFEPTQWPRGFDPKVAGAICNDC
jgi:hypothetical protein